VKVVIELRSLKEKEKETDRDELLPSVASNLEFEEKDVATSLEWFGLEGGLVELDGKPCFIRGTKKSFNSTTGAVTKHIQIQELTADDIKHISQERNNQMEGLARQHAAARAGIELVDEHSAKKAGLVLPGNSVVS